MLKRMVDYAQLFKGKKVTQMGLGVLGRGVGDAEWLAQAGAELLVTDLKTEEELKPSLDRLAPYTNITYRLGEHYREDFRDRDLVLKGPGVPLDSPFIAEARQNGVPIDMSASLFVRIAPVPLVGLTGTRGKSTVTQLVDAMLQGDGRTTLLGGNVRGVSNLSLFDAVTPEHIAVFELDSWQCQGFGETRSLDAPGVRQGPISPNVAVFTTFMVDHMNYYPDMETYLHDKAQIFLHQNEDDVLVLGRQTLEALETYKKRIRARTVVADHSTVPKRWQPKLLGEHNRYNIGIAVEVARALGVDDEVIEEVVETFKALPGRTQLVREVRGIQIYNDTNATTPDATIASLRALDSGGKKNVVLIMGGADKGLDMSKLLDELPLRTKAVVLLKGTGTGKLQFHGRHVDTMTVDTLAQAFTAAIDRAEKGDAILFSPAFASFGMFKNEYDRGEQFNELVASLE